MILNNDLQRRKIPFYSVHPECELPPRSDKPITSPSQPTSDANKNEDGTVVKTVSVSGSNESNEIKSIESEDNEEDKENSDITSSTVNESQNDNEIGKRN